MYRLFLIFVLISLGVRSSADEAESSESLVSYARDVAPILQRKCVACHREKQSEGGLSLETAAAVMRGGDSGASVVAKQLDESVLYARVSGAEEPIMPPEDNSVGAKPLTEPELDLIRRWILQGATVDAEVATTSLEVQPIPASIRDSFALAVSPDRQALAIARANRVELLDASTGELTGALVDPAIDQKGVADIDFIQAIDFSPSGDRIATGGYRTVRVWKRAFASIDLPPALQAAKGPVAVSPDRTRAAILNSLGDVELWEVNADAPSMTIRRSGAIATLVWQADATVVIADESGLVRVVDAAKGVVSNELKVDTAIDQVCQSSDGRFIAVLGVNRQLRLFDQLAAISPESLAGLSDCTAVAFVSPTVLAIGTASGKVMLMELPSGTIGHQFDQGDSVSALVANHEGSRLASGGASGVSKLWNVADGALVATLAGDPASELRIASLDDDIKRERSWSDRLNGQTAAIEELLKKEEEALAKVSEAREAAAKDLKAKQEQVASTQVMIDDSKKAIAAAGQRVESATKVVQTSESAIADAKQMIETITTELPRIEKQLTDASAEAKAAEAKVAEAMKQLAEAKAKVDLVAKQVEEKKTQLASQNQRNVDATKQRDEAKQEITKASAEMEQQKMQLAKHEEMLGKVKGEADTATKALAEREQALATAKTTRDVAAENVPRHKDKIRQRGNRLSAAEFRREELVTARQQMPRVAAILFAPQESLIAVVNGQGGAVMYDAESGHPVRRVADSQTGRLNSARAAFLSEEQLLVSSRFDAPSLVRTRPEWSLEYTLGGLQSDLIADRVTSLDFTTDGMSLAIGSGVPSRSGQVLIVDPTTGRVLRRYDELHSDTVLCLKFSPDDRMLATASSDKTIRLMDLQRNEVVGALDGHTHHVLSIAWNDDATKIASSSADGTIKTWDVVTSQREKTMVNIKDEITALAYLPGTTRVVSAAADGYVRIHETNNGGQVSAVAFGGDAQFAIELSPDAGRVFSSGHSGKVHVIASEGLKAIGDWE